jgi:hypothetical protein
MTEGLAVAAGAVGFAIGTENLAPITSPSTRCGCTGLRPTFGPSPPHRRPHGPLAGGPVDKVGPIARLFEGHCPHPRRHHGADRASPSSIRALLQLRRASRSAEASVHRIAKKMFQRKTAAAPKQSASHHLDAASPRGHIRASISMSPTGLHSLRNHPPQSRPRQVCEESHPRQQTPTTSLKAQGPTGSWPTSSLQAWFIPCRQVIQADRLRRQTAAIG